MLESTAGAEQQSTVPKYMVQGQVSKYDEQVGISIYGGECTMCIYEMECGGITEESILLESRGITFDFFGTLLSIVFSMSWTASQRG